MTREKILSELENKLEESYKGLEKIDEIDIDYLSKMCNIILLLKLDKSLDVMISMVGGLSADDLQKMMVVR